MSFFHPFESHDGQIIIITEDENDLIDDHLLKTSEPRYVNDLLLTGNNNT
jgi:hypothetical protein